MNATLSEKRLAENQLYFRKPNEKIYKEFKELKEVAAEHNKKELLEDADPLINFNCECSDENCKKRIRIKPSKYGALHKNSSQFILLPGHNVPAIERIVKSTKNYIVVEKYNTPKGNISKPNPTNLHNA